MPRAFPLYLPTAEELRFAHDAYVARESRDYAYRAARCMLTGEPTRFTEAEAIDLLLRIWNSRSRYTHKLTLANTDALLAASEATRFQFEDRPITSLESHEHGRVADLFDDFRQLMGPVGAAKALGVLHPRFFPLWDTAIAEAYCGSRWSEVDRCPRHYLEFMGICVEQCSSQVSEEEFGPSLLKTLDEWNYCIWTHGWIPEPGG